MKFRTVIDQAFLLTIHEMFSEIQNFQIWRRCAILKLCAKHFSDRSWKVQSVPLATEPGISLKILTPMKILQRNLNSTCYDVTFLKQ